MLSGLHGQGQFILKGPAFGMGSKPVGINIDFFPGHGFKLLPGVVPSSSESMRDLYHKWGGLLGAGVR